MANGEEGKDGQESPKENQNSNASIQKSTCNGSSKDNLKDDKSDGDEEENTIISHNKNNNKNNNNNNNNKEGNNQLQAALDPRLTLRPSPTLRPNDHAILSFPDGRRYFAQCIPRRKCYKGRLAPVKINKRGYPTHNLIGLPYGTVLELGKSMLIPLSPDEDVVPNFPLKRNVDEDGAADVENDEEEEKKLENGPISEEATADEKTLSSDRRDDGKTNDDSPDSTNLSSSSTPPSKDETLKTEKKQQEDTNGVDNRNLVDSNSSQSMKQADVEALRDSGTHGSRIVAALIANSSTYNEKTIYSKAKYIARKQRKYQPRCRIVRCTSRTICETLFARDPRKIMNLREDTLAQILSYSNASAGRQVLLFETAWGLLTGAFAQRMGGYGKVISIFTGQQPAFIDTIARFNLTFAEHHSIKWIHSGEFFADELHATDINKGKDDDDDPELQDRNSLEWPCPLQSHTHSYLQSMSSDIERMEFLSRRSSRFARKLTRHTTKEVRQFIWNDDTADSNNDADDECKKALADENGVYVRRGRCDCIVIATKYDPTETLLTLMPHLAPSRPFVVFCEFLEPLVHCFRAIQDQSLAINLRLMDTWMREYQILDGRTHPNMNMSQNGGFLLTGIRLDPVHGKNELDEELLKELREKAGGRRGRKKQKRQNAGTSDEEPGQKKKHRGGVGRRKQNEAKKDENDDSNADKETT